MLSQILEIVVIVLIDVILINLVQTTIHLEEITNLVQTIIPPEEKVIHAVQGIDKLPCPSGLCPRIIANNIF